MGTDIIHVHDIRGYVNEFIFRFFNVLEIYFSYIDLFLKRKITNALHDRNSGFIFISIFFFIPSICIVLIVSLFEHSLYVLCSIHILLHDILVCLWSLFGAYKSTYRPKDTNTLVTCYSIFLFAYSFTRSRLCICVCGDEFSTLNAVTQTL